MIRTLFALLILFSFALSAGAQQLNTSGTAGNTCITSSNLTGCTLAGTTTLPGTGSILPSGEVGFSTPAVGGVPVTVGGTLNTTTLGATTVNSGNISATALIGWSAKTQLDGSFQDGSLILRNNALTSFGLLQFGGVTSSFAAIKPSGTTLIFRRADDLANVSIVASGGTFSGLGTGTNADFVCLSATGVLLVQTTACTISSMRFKRDIAPLEGDALARVNALNPVAFNMKDAPNADPNYDKRQIGLMAENVAAVDPRMAIYEDDGVTPKSYRQESIIAALVAAVKELWDCRLRVMGACWF